MHFRKLFLVAIIATLSFSCGDDEEESNYGMRITPNENYLEREEGSVINFVINVESSDELTRYRVTETIDKKSTNILKDESIRGNFYSDWFDYTVPDTLEFGSHEIQLIFSTFDIKGRQIRRAKFILVDVVDRTLTEYGGNTIFSSLSNQFDAYDLLTGNPKYSSDTTAHIRDLSKANPNDTLSRNWSSPVPEIKFVRFNSFDYGNATEQSVRTAYDTGIKNDTIRNLRSEDILLTKIENKYIAVKLNFVTDQSGNINDRYIFSIKR